LCNSGDRRDLLVRSLSRLSKIYGGWERIRGFLKGFLVDWGVDVGEVSARVPRFWERPRDLVRFLVGWCRDRGVDEDELFDDLGNRILLTHPKVYAASEGEIKRLLEGFFRSRGVDVGEVYENVPRFWERRESLVRFLEGKGVRPEEVPLWIIVESIPEVDGVFREEAERRWRMIPKFLRDRYERWNPRASEVLEEILRQEDQIDEKCRSEGLSKKECRELKFEVWKREWRRFYLEYCGVEDPWSFQDQLLDEYSREAVKYEPSMEELRRVEDSDFIMVSYLPHRKRFIVTVRVDGDWFESDLFAEIYFNISGDYRVYFMEDIGDSIKRCKVLGDVRRLLFAVRPYYSPKHDVLFTPLDIINYDEERFGPLDLMVVSDAVGVFGVRDVSTEYRYVFLCFDKFLEKFFKPV